MPNLHIKNRLRQLALLLFLVSLCSVYAYHAISMWQEASTYSEDGSVSLSVFAEASKFLSQNLKQNEMALVPMRDVFYSLNPQMRDSLIDYKSLWDATKIVLKADTKETEAARVRSYFIDFLRENPQVRYVVRDWVDPYARLLYEATVSDELMNLLSEAKNMPFILSTGWSNRVTIYENVQYAALFAMKLSSPPRQYGTDPADAPITFDSNGMTIQKTVPSLGFYMPLESGINSSKPNYMTMRVKVNVESLNLLLAFYYDKNRDGKFSGYDIDYIKQVGFNPTELGWIQGQWYKICPSIPKADDPIVDIAIIALGEKNGTITFSDLIVYSQIDIGTVFVDASAWLSENLKENEVALVSSPGSFFLANLKLQGKLVSYRSLWDTTGVVLRTNTTEEETLNVRSYFIDFLRENPQVRYVVRDWVDPYAERLYDAATMDELMILLNELKVMTLPLGTGWSRILTIYENVRFEALFAMNVTSPPEKYVTAPHDLMVQFDSNGTTIRKVGPSVGLYLPLKTGINTSNLNYVAMRIRLDVENLNLVIAFYYDKDGDGKWGGYGVDPTSSWAFNQTRQGWAFGEWYKIAWSFSKADYPYPIVQIAIFADGDTDGTITIGSLTLFGEAASQG